jgi:hypothetical protein
MAFRYTFTAAAFVLLAAAPVGGFAAGKPDDTPVPGELLFSVKRWQGDYASKDVPGGVVTTPVVGAVHSVRADGTGLRKVVALGKNTDYPTASPDGRWVYFQSNATGRSQIYRCRPDGSGVVNLTAGHRLGKRWRDAYGYSLSADGTKLLYTVHDGDTGRVALANADGSGPRLIAPELGYTYMAALSPTNDRVVFSGPARGYRLLLAALPDGKPVELTPDHPECFVPQFTPDGKTVVFIRRDGDVYRVDGDGRNLRRLTEGNRHVEFRLSPEDKHGSTDGPHVSADGKRIAYVAARDGVANVWVMDIDGRRQRQLTFRKTPCGRARWSPDGRHVAFVSFEGKYPQLFVVAAGGGEPRQLTRLDGAVYFVNWMPTAAADAAPARGPLRVHPANRRYFTDGSGKVVFLTGSHTWGNLQDYTYGTKPSPPPLDFDAYLAFLERHHHNFFRLWAWESAWNPGALQSTTAYDPMPYQRPGPGKALDGKPKFDLTRFNPAYFDRLRARVRAAGRRGMYVSVMLFQGFSIEGKGNDGGDPWQGHPFHPRNNVNGLDGGGARVHTLARAAVTGYQEAYVRKVIGTVSDLDNVLYEITNEDTGGAANTAWQVHMLRFIQKVEAGRPKQHPVGMTVQWPQGDDRVLFRSPAAWISPGDKVPTADGRKVILNDTDHCYFWTGLKADGPAAQRAWVWENFSRGNQCLFMDPYLDPSHDRGRNHPRGSDPDPYWDGLRDAMGQTRLLAGRLDLAPMTPHGDLASTGYCLADAGKAYVVYLPAGGTVTVDLTAAVGKLAAEWIRPGGGREQRGAAVAGGAKRTLRAPFAGDAVLYLRRQ